MVPQSLCPHQSVCSGCGGSIDTLLCRATKIFRGLGIQDYTLVRGSPTGWRTRAKLAVRRQGAQGLAIGLFRKGSHEVVPISQCVCHHPRLNDALQRLNRLPPHVGYDEQSGRGQLRYIQAVVERETNRVQLTFVLSLPTFDTSEVKEWGRRANAFLEEDPSLWHSFWINLQPLPVNTIFGPHWKRVNGEPFVWETIAGCIVPFLPSHFGQANPEMFERVVHDLIALLPPNATIVELFAGMGVMSLALRPYCASVTAIERDGTAMGSFLEAKKRLPLALQDGLRYIVQDASAGPEVVQGASAVVVDPPRKGLPLNLVHSIAREESITDLFYLSCHFPTLERDMGQIMNEGGFSVSFARSYLFFPGTEHIETLVRFSRKKSG